MSRCSRFITAIWILGLGLANAEGKEATLTFEQDIRPILKEFCFDCHGAEQKLQGGLDLRLRRLIANGGDHGAALVPGMP